MAKKRTKSSKVAAARAAIAAGGGVPTFTDKINEILGLRGSDRLSTVRVNKWKYTGIPPKFTQASHLISGMPRHFLEPEVFGHEAAA